MTTTQSDRQVLRDWRDTHDDVQPDRDGHACSKLIWIDGSCVGQCRHMSAWIARGQFLCEAHTVERIRVWTGEVSA